MKKRTVQIIALLAAVISLVSLVACSSEQNGNETKALTNTTTSDTTVPITTESVAPIQVTTLPATTEAQTEPPATEPAVDISGVVFKEENLYGGSYIAPKDWECKEADGQKYYYADVPTGAYILVGANYLDPLFADHADDSSFFIDLFRANWPNSTPISTDSMMINNVSWIFDKLETQDNHIVDCRYYFRGNAHFYSIAFYPKEGNQIPRFQTIYEKVFDSIDTNGFEVEQKKSSVLDIPAGTVLVDNEYVKITYQGIWLNDNWAALFGSDQLDINLLIENKADCSLGMMIENFSINGYMCTPYFAVELPQGKKTQDSIIVIRDQLDRTGITEFNEIQEAEWTFEVYDMDKANKGETDCLLGSHQIKLSIASQHLP